MEFINKIELKGVVGRVSHSKTDNKETVRFSLVVENIFDSGDMKFVESTWFSCIAFESEKIKDLSKLKSNIRVHLEGRMRMSRYTNEQGEERHTYEVICHKLEVLD